MTTLDDVVAAWNASEAAETADALDVWYQIATDFVANGGALPDYMSNRYRLMSKGAQSLPPVTITAERSWGTALAVAALAWWATRR